MAESGSPGAWPRPLIALISVIAVVGTLYLAQAFLIPLALAILITFVMSPVVTVLERWRLGRVPAVVLVVLLLFSALGGGGYLMTLQLANLGNALPTYESNIRRKIYDLRYSVRSFFNLQRVEQAVKEVQKTSSPGSEADPPQPGVEKQGTDVKAPPEAASAVSFLPSTLATVLERLATAGLVLVLVIFMLIYREDLRNRILRLVGYGRITDATKALDEAGQRISRYLLMQSIINGSFGLLFGLALFFIGVPYSLLWGILAGLLRFIPYLGAIAAALLPLAMGFAYFHGWLPLLLILGVFAILEINNYMVMEPLLYGRSAGVSPVAILVTVAFWTWLWGPIGLLLSTPLTVCLIVLGRHVPSLTFLGILMSDEQVLDTKVIYYQRLLARDHDEAPEIVEEFLEKNPPERIYDELLLPALNFARSDLEKRKLTQEDLQSILQATREIVEDLADRARHALPHDQAPAEPGPEEQRLLVLGFAARDEIDELALLMLRNLLSTSRYDVQIVSAAMLGAEVVSLVEERRPSLVVIGAVPTGGLGQARYLVKRIRVRFPALKLVVGRWGSPSNVERNYRLLQEAGADQVALTLRETTQQIDQLSHRLSTAEAELAHPV